MPVELDDRGLRVIGNNAFGLEFYDDSRVLRQRIYLTSANVLNIGDAGTGESGGGGETGAGGAPAQAQYLVLSLHDELPNSRRLDIGNGLSAVDRGASKDLDLSVDLGTGLAFSANRVVLGWSGTPESVDLGANAGGSSLYAARTDHQHQLDASIAPTWTGQHTFQDTITARDILPQLTDAYDLGSTSKLWRKGYLSELETVLFALNTVTISGARQVWGHNAGTLAADLADSDDTCDFGQAMTVGDFVEMRGYLQVEYFEVGANVAGTVYKIGADASGDRDLDGSGANDWPAGTPYLVLGQDGDGRVEINAAGPNISILEQGATYNANTEYVRLGNMRNTYGTGANDRWGFGVGDYAGGNYLSYNAEGALAFKLKAGAGAVTIDADGIALSEGLGIVNYISWKSGATILGQVTTDLSSGDSQMYLDALNPTATGDYAMVHLSAWGYDDASYARLTVRGEDTAANMYLGFAINGVQTFKSDLTTGGTFLAGGGASGDVRIGGGLCVGDTSADPADDQIIAMETISGWLPVCTYTHLPSGMSADPSYPFIIAIPRAGTITDWIQSWYVFDTNDGDHYWNMQLYRLSDGALKASFDTSAGSPDTWSQTSTTCDFAMATSGRGYYIRCSKTGSPGNLTLAAPAIYAR